MKEQVIVKFSRPYDLINVGTFAPGVEYKLDADVAKRLAEKSPGLIEVIEIIDAVKKSIAKSTEDKSMTHKKREKKS